MDPRHPELALPRIKELTKQFGRVLADISKESVSNKLGELEREGILVVQELSLVAPRLHEMVIQASRQRRHDIARGVLDEPQDTAVELPVEKTGMMDAVEKVAPAPKKKTTKKKTTKKAEK